MTIRWRIRIDRESRWRVSGSLVGMSHADGFKKWRVEHVGSCFDVCYLFLIQRRYAITSDFLARELWQRRSQSQQQQVMNIWVIQVVKNTNDPVIWFRRSFEQRKEVRRRNDGYRILDSRNSPTSASRHSWKRQLRSGGFFVSKPLTTSDVSIKKCTGKEYLSANDQVSSTSV